MATLLQDAVRGENKTSKQLLSGNLASILEAPSTLETLNILGVPVQYGGRDLLYSRACRLLCKLLHPGKFRYDLTQAWNLQDL
jgi:hypothetical protein